MKRLALTILTAAFGLLFVIMPVTPVFAQAQIEQNLCAGANLDVNTNCNTGGISDLQAQERINSLIRTVINLFSLIVGVVAVIMIIVGGLKYITSGGDSGNVTGAKNTILYAVIGLVVVALSQFIVRFVLSKVSNPS
jgi:cytochrome bd-type quinol oxidase subunit 2